MRLYAVHDVAFFVVLDDLNGQDVGDEQKIDAQEIRTQSSTFTQIAVDAPANGKSSPSPKSEITLDTRLFNFLSDSKAIQRFSEKMGDSSRKIDLDKLISYSDDLVKVLQDKRDINSLTLCLEQSNSLSSSCNADFNEVRSLLEDYQKKIDECKLKTEQTRSEVASDAELDLLQGELEEELEKERMLGEELSIELNNLEQQRISILERKKNLQKLEQDELRAQMMLSMYASVTNIVPNLDNQSKISGYIVEKDKNSVEKFEFDSSKVTALDVCNEIWKIVGS